MITGTVSIHREAIVPVTVRGPGNREETVEAIVDTGFNGDLTLSPSLVARLGLRWHHFGRGLLADGSETSFDVYEAVVLWEGTPRAVMVDTEETEPLLGMAMLDGHKLTIDVRPGGSVTIKAQPPQPPR